MTHTEKEVALNRIAKELQVEYRDFHDADELEDSADLCANFRVQLESIFETLGRHGIDVENGGKAH